MRRFLFGLAVSAVLGLSADARAQFSGRGGFGGGSPPDANQIWVFTAGSDVPSIDLNQRTDIRERLQRRGTPIPPDGILRKEVFVAELQQRMAQGGGMFGGRDRGGDRGGPPGAMTMSAPMSAPGSVTPGGFAGPPGGGGPPPWAGGSGGAPGTLTDDQIKSFMQRYDKNGDGRISLEEAQSSDRMKGEFARLDLNRDGALDLAEYKAYIEERMGQRNRDSNGQPGGPPGSPPQYGSSGSDRRDDRGDRRDDRRQEEEEVVRPTVFRYGKLPKELPSWFEKLDTDADGQLGLYEWRIASKSSTEFVEMDLNGDGYLTAEEWLRYQKRMLESPRPTDSLASIDGEAPSDRGNRGGPPSMGGDRGNFSFGRGGPPSSSDKKSEREKGSEDRGRDRGGRGGNPFTGGR